MKRDMELVRKVLLGIQDGNPNGPVDGYSEGAIKYHRALVIEALLAQGQVLNDNTINSEIPAAVILKKLTWEGHDFIDAIESDANWAKVKDYLKEAGKQLTLETIKYAVKQLFGIVAT